MGVKKSTISLYETGKSDPADEFKIIIARYFNVSIDYLIGVIDDEVCYYNKKNFFKLPENISEEEGYLIKNFIDFICYKRKIM